MQEFSEKKKEEKKQAEVEQKAAPPIAARHAPAIAEGPMALKETQKVERMAREQFEKSVQIELEQIRRWQNAKKKAKAAKKGKQEEKKGKPRGFEKKD